MRRVLHLTLLLGLTLLLTTESFAGRSLEDYRYFRALSVDLAGRPPSREEIADFEATGFDLDRWIEDHLKSASYADRIRRIYMDLLRLDLPPTVHFGPASLILAHVSILGPDSKPVDVYFRGGQRRVKPEIDAQFCLTEDEIGAKFAGGGPVGTLKPVARAVFDARTVEVKPWWLYADYRSAHPSDLATYDWIKRFPTFGLYVRMFLGADGAAPKSIRVCREEAQTAPTGHVYVTGRVVTKRDKLLPGRSTRLPADITYAKSHKDEQISCLSGTGFQSSTECGCGVGLERCLPQDGNRFELPYFGPLDADHRFGVSYGDAFMWMRAWWNEEPRHFLEHVLLEDADWRGLLDSRGTTINGPLAQFYRFLASATCCGTASELGYGEPEALFEPTRVPAELIPHHADDWRWIPDRGPHAAGLMTMPVFLMKYGSRRARAHVVYNAFLCKDLIAESLTLTPSTEPDLTKRPGCANCHQTLEPLAAYFTRVQESDWTYLPAKQFPISLPGCTTSDPTRMPGVCRNFYDPAFTDASHTSLRGALAAPGHAESGPPGFAAEITQSPEFATCVVRNVAQSLLGRSLTTEDGEWQSRLTRTFVAGGYRMRALVRAIVTSDRYRHGNDSIPERQ